MDSKLTVAILVVSTTAAQDPTTDLSTQVLADVLAEDGNGQWKVTDTKIVTDDAVDIQRQVTAWTDSSDPVNLIITTGGTGFAVADHTPEVSEESSRPAHYSNIGHQAISIILHKQAPGLVHAMLSTSLAVTPCTYTF